MSAGRKRRRRETDRRPGEGRKTRRRDSEAPGRRTDVMPGRRPDVPEALRPGARPAATTSKAQEALIAAAKKLGIKPGAMPAGKGPHPSPQAMLAASANAAFKRGGARPTGRPGEKREARKGIMPGDMPRGDMPGRPRPKVKPMPGAKEIAAVAGRYKDERPRG